jgi:transposase
MLLPENLRREIIIIEPTEDVTGCTIIGEEVTEVLDLIPAEFFVKRYIRYKYARANGEGIITASLPDRVIDRAAKRAFLRKQSLPKWLLTARRTANMFLVFPFTGRSINTDG